MRAREVPGRPGRGKPHAAGVTESAAQRPRRAVLELQATAGNRAVSSLLSGGAPAVQRRADPVQRALSGEDLDFALRKIDAALNPDAFEEPESAGGPAVQPSRAPGVQRQGPEQPAKPKPGKPGDVVKAILATPEGKKAVEEVKEKAKADIKSLEPGETAAVVTAAIAIAAPTVTAAMIHPDSRSFMLSQISGQKVSIPGLDGVSAKVDFDKDGRPTGGMVYVNVGQFLPPSLGFK